MMQPAHILFVDLPQSRLRMLGQYFPRSQFTQAMACNATEVSDQLKKLVPDIVFIFKEAYQVNPLALCQALAQQGIAVVICASKPTRDDVVDTVRHGALDLLVIPSDPKTTLFRANRVLARLGKVPPPPSELRIDFGAAVSLRQKVDLLIHKVHELLALPFTVMRTIQLCGDPNASIQDLVTPVQSDPAIAAVILRRANSVAFGGSEPIVSLQRALTRIGMKETRNIASAFSVFKLFSSENKSFGFSRIHFWGHSLAVAVCAQRLAKGLLPPAAGQPEDAFLAGLMHDIGKMVLDDFLNSAYQKAIQQANMERLPCRLAEARVFEIDHAYVGSKVSEQWRFPAPIVEAIARHHQYETLAAQDSVSLARIVTLANQMAKSLLIGSGGDFLIEADAAPLWKALPSTLNWQELVSEAMDIVRESFQMLKIPREQLDIPAPNTTQMVHAGLLTPAPSPWTPLLSIGLFGKDLPPELLTDVNDLTTRAASFQVVIADLAGVENTEAATSICQTLEKAGVRHLVISPFKEQAKALHVPLDAYAIDKAVRAALPPPTAGK